MTSPVSVTPGHLDRYLTTEELAERLKLSPRTVQGWRRRKEGPSYVRVGRRCLYAEAAVAEYLATRVLAKRGAA